MKKLVATAAVLASLGGAAFAQVTPATNHPTPVAAQPSQSLLNTLLANAAALSAILTNLAQNMNAIDGSINLTVGRDLTNIGTDIAALNGSGHASFGALSQIGSNVTARDLSTSFLNVLTPLSVSAGDQSTTAIGAMQSGAMTATLDASGVVDRVTSAATASTTAANISAEAYGGIAHTLAFQNVAANAGDVNASLQLKLADVNAILGKIGSTAIGAMGSGSLTATITGNMNDVTATTAAIITALVDAP